MTSVGITPGHCVTHGYHGWTVCPHCLTSTAKPPPATSRTSGETAALNAIAAALHRIADALEKENP